MHFLFLLAFFIIFNLTAQNSTLDTLITQLSNRVCSCIDSKFEKVKNQNEAKLQRIARKCLMDNLAYERHSVYLEEVFSTKEGLMNAIIFELELTCPKITASIIMENNEYLNFVKNDTFPKIHGILTNAFLSDFLLFEITNKNGDPEKYVLMDYFLGAEDIIDHFDDHKNKAVKFSYDEKWIYNVRSRRFEKHKILKEIAW